MATSLHKNLPESELHEPKGISRALINTVYRATGTGSGVWGQITPNMIKGNLTSGVVGSPVVLDASGGFTTGKTPGYASGRVKVSQALGQLLDWAPDNTYPTISSQVRVQDSKFVFPEAGLYTCTFDFEAIPVDTLGETSKVVFVRSDGMNLQELGQGASATSITFLVNMATNGTIHAHVAGENSKRAAYFSYTIRKVV